MKIYYIETADKPKLWIRKYKINQDNLKIYMDLNKKNNINKIKKILIKNEIESVVLSKELLTNTELINILNSNSIKIFNGRWLEKYITFELLEYIINQKKIKKEETEIAITSNEISDSCIETIKTLARQYKRITVVTNHPEKLKKIEKMMYDKYGILILVMNNKNKSLLKSKIILNFDFNKLVLNKYKINENAVIVNIEGDMKINSKRFSGINVNDYEINIGKEETIWRENMNQFKNKDLFEAKLYMKDSFYNIRRKILKNKISVKEVYGENGKIERFS